MSTTNCDHLVRHAFEEQKSSALPWYKNMSELMNLAQSDNFNATRRGASVKAQLEKLFHQVWGRVADESSKLKFYRQVKEVPSLEAYLSIPNRDVRKSVARLRSSSHRLNVETARYNYTTQRLSKSTCYIDNTTWLKSCNTCCDENAMGLLQLPFAEDPIIEDERHILATCPAYHHLRLGASDYILSTLLAWEKRLPTLFEVPCIDEFSALIHKIFLTRFPKVKKDKSTSKT